jgi:hypothetical protein
MCDVCEKVREAIRRLEYCEMLLERLESRLKVSYLLLVVSG